MWPLSPPDEVGSPERWCLAFPLRSREAETGLVLLARGGPRESQDDDLTLGSLLVDQASIAIDNANLFRRVRTLAERDGLTGLLTRREFFRLAEAAFARASSDDKPFAAVMLDVDHFKRFNDRYGHATGDEVLRGVARVCAGVLREGDVLGRYGGEEFALVLPQGDRATAAAIADRIRTAVGRHDLQSEEFGRLGVTVSVGVATRMSGDTLAALLSRADQALYVSKEKGRNRVTVVSVDTA